MTQSELMEELLEVFGGEQRLADAIRPVRRREVLRWANGSREVPLGAWESIGVALQSRRRELDGLLREVDEHAAVREKEAKDGEAFHDRLQNTRS